MQDNSSIPPTGNDDLNNEVIKLHISAEQYRAFQRCMWILINETGKTQIDIMNEMVNDFLIKHGC